MNPDIEFWELVGFLFISSFNKLSPSSLNNESCNNFFLRKLEFFLLVPTLFNLRLFDLLLLWLDWRLELRSLINGVHLLLMRLQVAGFSGWEVSACFYIRIHLKIPFWTRRNLSFDVLLKWFLLWSFRLVLVSTYNRDYWLDWGGRGCRPNYWVRSIWVLFRNRFENFDLVSGSSKRGFCLLNFFYFFETFNIDKRTFRRTQFI